ncbi:MAG TPA: hypothetical protein VIS06_20785, partial [Mycobacteriales bacterium]
MRRDEDVDHIHHTDHTGWSDRSEWSEHPEDLDRLVAGLTVVGRRLVARGLVSGSGGNLSARTPDGRHL